MFLKKRILVSVAAAWLSAVLAIAAIVVTATAANGGAALDDVQIGERGALTRIALICSNDCDLENDENGEFLLRGVTSEVDIDLKKRSRYVRSFATIPTKDGSRIKIIASEAVRRVENKSCKIGGRPATCIDLFFNEEAQTLANAAPEAAPTPRRKPQKASGPVHLASNPVQLASNNAGKPALRDTAEERYAVFTKLAAPERLTPPDVILANVTPIEPSVDVGKPVVTANPKGLGAPEPRSFNFADDAEVIVGKSLGPAECAGAEEELKVDAWALEAMVNLGYCHAMVGETDEAQGIFSRLLEYTPDNYHALVGQALIAAEAGDRQTARKYFQDALNALPPLDESNRIVEAMASL